MGVRSQYPFAATLSTLHIGWTLAATTRLPDLPPDHAISGPTAIATRTVFGLRAYTSLRNLRKAPSHISHSR